jgi:hypothetical protein
LPILSEANRTVFVLEKSTFWLLVMPSFFNNTKAIVVGQLPLQSGPVDWRGAVA